MIKIKTTPLFNWLLNDSKRISFLYGSSGSGKSYQACIYLLRKLFTEKDISILVMRKQTPSLRMTTYKLMLELLDKYFSSYNYNHDKTNMVISFRNSDMTFKGLDESSKIRSSEFNYIFLEECSEFTLTDYEELKLRLRKPNNNPGAFNQILLLTNPTSIFSWIYTDVYMSPDPSIAKHKSLWSDNNFLDKTYTDELAKLQGNYRKVFYEGEFGLMQGLVFPNFEIYDKIFDTVVSNAWGIDFGYVHKSSLVCVNFLDSGKFYVEEFIAEPGLTNTEFIKRIKEIIPSNDDANIYCDSSEPARINEMYQNDLNVHRAHKDIKAGLDFCIENFLGCTASSVNLISELRFYSFGKDRMEQLLPDPIKVKDDSICAMRYAAYTHSLYGNRVSQNLDWLSMRPGA